MLVLRACKAIRDCQAILVSLVPQVLLVRLVRPELRDHKVLKDRKALRVSQDHKVQLVLRTWCGPEPGTPARPTP